MPFSCAASSASAIWRAIMRLLPAAGPDGRGSRRFGEPEAALDTAFIDPGKPWQNGADESFNGKFRDEFLTLEWLRNRVDAQVGIARWRQHYNQVRPHSSLGYLTPLECKAIRTANVTEGRSSAPPARDAHEAQEPTDEGTQLTGAIL